MKVTPIPEFNCPSCGNALNYAEPEDGGPGEPTKGDWACCFICGELLRFDDGLKLHVLTPEEEGKVSPEMWSISRNIKDQLDAMKRDKGLS